ncbi:MAG: hypothetical protein J0L64_13545 [Acidobacteria bacterium]|nr:hypothetical protein [Acidobacteriota bacterium]
MGELSRIATSATALYAEGLQMCQATRNILLDPANQKAWSNHAAASGSFGQIRDELERDVRKWSSDTSARAGALSVKADFERHLTIQQRIHMLAKQGDFENAKRMLNSEDTPLWRKYKDDMLALRAKMTKEAGAAKAEVAAQCVWANRLAWLSSLLLIGASLATFVVSSRVAIRLRTAMDLLTASSGQVQSSSLQVAQASDSIASGASQQAASVEEVSASAEEIKSLANAGREKSDEAAELTREAASNFESTNRGVYATLDVMAEIDRSNQEIAKITKVIDQIAFQTNILALNAAVEASRAGEAGLGFAVVAGEVRNLAQRSAEAASQINQQINAAVERSHEGHKKAREAAEGMRSFVAASDQVRTMVEEVKERSHQQLAAIGQIAQTISQIAQTTQSVAAGAEEEAASSSELASHGKEMLRVVDYLRSTITGSAAVTGGRS